MISRMLSSHRLSVAICAMVIVASAVWQSHVSCSAADPGAGLPLFRRPQPARSVAPSAVEKKKPIDSPAIVSHTNVSSDQTVGAEVDVDEVARRGDRVVVAGKGPMSNEDLAIGDALAPPPDDSHKWFISVIVDDGRESQALLYDLKHSSHLRSWLKVDDPKQSWAHATVYIAKDQTQDWRWKNLKVSRYPVMILQPPAKLLDEANPASWEWGDPKTVVWQWDGYDATVTERAKLRADAIRRATVAYIQAIARKRQGSYQATFNGPRSTPRPTPGPRDPGPSQGGDIGGPPPFQLPSYPVIPGGNPVFPSDPTLLPAGGVPQTGSPGGGSLLVTALSMLTTGTGMTNFLLIGLMGIQVWRAFRKNTGQGTLLDDESFARLQNLLTTLAGQTPGPR